MVKCLPAVSLSTDGRIPRVRLQAIRKLRRRASGLAKKDQGTV